MKRIYIVCLLCLLKVIAVGQQVSLDNQYLINPFALSPALAGSNGAVEAFGSFQQNWVGIDGAPVTKSFNMNGAITPEMGLGGAISDNSAGIFRTLSASLSYAYHVKLQDHQYLYFGVAGGALSNHIDLSGSNTGSANDPVLLNNMNKNATLFNATGSIIYRYRSITAGFEVPGLFEGSSGAGPTTSVLARQYIVHASMVGSLNEDWSVSPFALLQVVPSGNTLVEASALFKYKKQFWIAGTYLSNNTFAVSAGLVVIGSIAVNYSYEFGQGMLANASGSHEITIGFIMGKSKHMSDFSVFNTAASRSSKTPYFNWVGND